MIKRGQKNDREYPAEIGYCVLLLIGMGATVEDIQKLKD